MENIIITAALVLLCAATAVLLGRQGLLRFALRLLPDLIREAEKAFGAGEGSEKKNSVLAKWESAVPAPLRFLLSRDRVSLLIEELLSAMRREENEDKEEQA